MCQGPEAGMTLACLSNNKEASKVRGKLNKVIEEEGRQILWYISCRPLSGS